MTTTSLVMKQRQGWTTPSPRMEIVMTHDLYRQVAVLFEDGVGAIRAEAHAKDILAMCFHYWASHNYLTDPSLETYPVPTKMEHYHVPTVIDYIIDGVFWNNPDLLDAMTQCRVQQNQFDPVIYWTLQRLDEFYPPTGYEGLSEITVSLVRWARGDMVLAIG